MNLLNSQFYRLTQTSACGLVAMGCSDAVCLALAIMISNTSVLWRMKGNPSPSYQKLFFRRDCNFWAKMELAKS